MEKSVLKYGNNTRFNTRYCIKQALLQTHPIGTVEIRVDNTNPGTLYGGVWEKIEGKFLLASNSNYALGNTGGEATHTLSVNEIPSHSHSTESVGAHTHTTNSTGAHTHTRGSMNITGTFGTGGGQPTVLYKGDCSGAFYVDAGSGNMASMLGTTANTNNDRCSKIGLKAANNWTGQTSSNGAHSHNTNSTGAHTHAITSTGGSSAHNNIPPYLVVSVWKRVR